MQIEQFNKRNNPEYYKSIYDDLLDEVELRDDAVYFYDKEVEDFIDDQDDLGNKILIYAEILKILKERRGNHIDLPLLCSRIYWKNGLPHWRGNNKIALRRDINGELKIDQFRAETCLKYHFLPLSDLSDWDSDRHINALVARIYVKNNLPYCKSTDKPLGTMYHNKLRLSQSVDGIQRRIYWKDIRGLVQKSTKYFYFIVLPGRAHEYGHSGSVKSLLDRDFEYLYVFDTETNKSFTRGE